MTRDSGVNERVERRCSSCMVTENQKTKGHWSQRSISQSLQRAEVLLRNTFNPNMRWLFHVRSQDKEEDNFVIAHNLVSRSSARLLHLQQALLTVASQSQLGEAHMESSQGHYRNLWKLLEQRSLLLFIHEYTRRAHLTAAYSSRVRHLLAHQLKKSHLAHKQTPSSFRVGLCSLSQELRVHLSHWHCLFSKVQSDHYLRPGLVQRTGLLIEVKQTLDLLALQASVLMEHYVYAVLTAIAQTELDTVQREVLEDILTGAELYNQAVEEHRLQHSVTELRTVVLQQAHYSLLDSCLPAIKRTYPSAFSVKELMLILAVYHTESAARQLQHWVSGQSQSCQAHTYLSSPNHTFHKTTDYVPGCHAVSNVLKNHHVLAKPLSVQHRVEGCQTNAEAVELSRVCQLEHTSVKLIFKALVSSSDMLASLISHTCTPEEEVEKLLTATGTDLLNGNSDMEMLYLPVINTAGSVELDSTKRGQNIEGTEPELTELEITRPDATESLGSQNDGDPVNKEIVGAGGATVEPHCVHLPHSVQWLDLGQSFVFSDLLTQYRTLLWSLSRQALRLTLHVPQTGKTTESINLQNSHRHFHILHKIIHATEAGLVPDECKAMLEASALHLLLTTACVYWDRVVCQSLGSALKDKCIISKQDGRTIMSLTMEHFLLLPHPLLSALCYFQSNYKTSGSFSLLLQRRMVSLVLASVHLPAVWIMSKAYQFLSSWSLNKFLLITQGDLKMLKESVKMLPCQIESLVNSYSGHNSTLHKHNQLLLRQQLEALDKAVSELQTFASLMLKTFSSDCKRKSGEIFERTMPSAVQWRPRHKTDFPSSPNEYAYLAAQTVIGQVLEAVAPLTDDARVQALSITMTAFMEAWMEHILKHQIKFSVLGALQLKQDFDFIRQMIQSDEYGLSAELHQQLLSLRVFQQVDSDMSAAAASS
ncbi:uncharacterized protein ccdc142 isoform X2 [Parambassis ranga]|uniref:Coiled-coil domain-containing protein 142 isoform X2 n=1 Tax=Parambassis ranga TaxID=210632 RepID=A0A6P7J6B6_9TELE|nr:coiled-coil domain-containing protein 142 isoform X2 [Parambassis ranga]XP_028272144.1 coiled-coil domain-containing protein 142 isoform X2 [Parambassis ranga]XP_028272145.1 coiled-coil domain-containing protein 142 isoform X2 [Parambassis ranga]